MAGNAFSGRPSEKHQLPVEGDQAPPELPEDLAGDHARRLWQVAVESLPHVLRPVDFAVLRLCCQSYQSALDLTDAGDHKQAAAMMRIFESYAKQIGLTPSSRRVVKPVGEKPPVCDQFREVEDWLARGGFN